MGSPFRYIEPVSGDVSEDIPAEFLLDAINQSRLAVSYDAPITTTRPENGRFLTAEEAHARRVAVAKLIAPTLVAADKLAEKYRTWAEIVEPAEPHSTGSTFIDLLMDWHDNVGEPFSLKAGKHGHTLRFVFACLCLRQCDRCIDAVLAGDVQAVGNYMWDIHLLLSEIGLEDEREEERERASAKAVGLNLRRHAKRNEDSSKVSAEWEANPSRFASAAEAGLHFADVLREQGRDYEPNTVRDWIRAHAKKKGIRLR